MKYQRIFSLSLFISIVSLTACDKTDNTNAETVSVSTPKVEVISAGETYKVIMDAEYPPFVFRDEKGNAIGMDVDILNAIAQSQDFSVTIEPMPGDLVIAEVAKGNYDIGIGGIYPGDINDIGFKDKVLKSHAYAYSLDSLATTKAVITDYDALKNYKVATLADSSYISDMEALYGDNFDNQVVESETVFLGYQQLLNGKVDAVLADKAVLAYYNQKYAKNANQPVKLSGQGNYFNRYYPMTIISRKDNPELARRINLGIQAIVKDGTYSKIHQKWLGTAPKLLPKPEPIPEGEASFISLPTS